MPLNKASITVASRIMLPTYVVLFALLGVNYLTDAPRLAASPGLSHADSVLALPAWGVLFLGCSGLMVFALWRRTRLLFKFALLIGAIAEGLWAACLFAGVFTADLSATAWLRDAVIAVACLASYASLDAGEVS